MAERHTDGDSVERDHTLEPQTPPSHVVEPDLKDAPASPLGVAAMWYMLGPILLIVVVIAAGAYFWLNDRNVGPDGVPAVGTIGERDDSTPGGFDPNPDLNSTGNEVEYRGGGQLRQEPMPGLGATVGQRIDLRDVVVIEARDSMFRVQHGNDTIEVIAPEDAPAVRMGAHVDVRGTVERGAEGAVRVRAHQVNTRNWE